MSSYGAGDAFYHLMFPVTILMVAAVGVLTYWAGVPSASLNCFLAVGFGVRLNNHVERRRFEEAEAEASRGWERLRGPVRAA